MTTPRKNQNTPVQVNLETVIPALYETIKGDKNYTPPALNPVAKSETLFTWLTRRDINPVYTSQGKIVKDTPDSLLPLRKTLRARLAPLFCENGIKRLRQG